uniref:Uncharacterized protein n=1 Tax=Andalucia godoyi TaxID=505711 RepID=M4QKG2_ANDGO|nr:hypothetical protein L069_p069 [Andalucia godoyi]AGH23963.1 hypothetical protein [Andalucia godoyi]
MYIYYMYIFLYGLVVTGKAFLSLMAGNKLKKRFRT